jgi:hypothetical protein
MNSSNQQTEPNQQGANEMTLAEVKGKAAIIRAANAVAVPTEKTVSQKARDLIKQIELSGFTGFYSEAIRASGAPESVQEMANQILQTGTA